VFHSDHPYQLETKIFPLKKTGDEPTSPLMYVFHSITGRILEFCVKLPVLWKSPWNVVAVTELIRRDVKMR
jgi:hypothetical protein